MTLRLLSTNTDFRVTAMQKGKSYINDKDLIEQSKNGDQTAFRQLFEKYWHDLFRIACKRLGSKENANDIVQEVFISLWNNIHKIEVDDSVGAYLFVSLRNKIFNHYEKQSLHLKYLLARPFNPVKSEEVILATIQSKEMQLIIADAVAAMPPKMKDIYQLSREQQLSIGEIADLLILSPQTVKNQLHRALERIRQSLRDSELAMFIFLFY